MWFLKSLLLLSISVVGIYAHGRLMDPPARNSMWRFGFANPINYNDNELFCGGFKVQFGQNNGKCGVCGDAFNTKVPREHESGGTYGNGIIGRRYVMGQRVTVEIELTANHMGHMVLKLCPVNDNKKVTPDACFDQYPLYLADDNSTASYFIPKWTPMKAILKYDVLLPPGIICEQCVVQWTYYTGNTWGKCKNGTEGMGCGAQETFRNCADIAIYSSKAAFPPDVDSNSVEEFPDAIYIKDSVSNRRYPLVVRSQLCVPTRGFEDEPDSEEWCKINCLKYPPNCPAHKCKCLDGCHAIGNLTGIEGTDIYCLRHCFHYGAIDCPKDECECYGEFNEIDFEKKIGQKTSFVNEIKKNVENKVEKNVYNEDETGDETVVDGTTTRSERNQYENEVESTTSNVDNEAESTTSNVDNEAESTTSNVDNEAESTTSNVDNEAESTTSNVDNEVESTTSNVDNEAENLSNVENVDIKIWSQQDDEEFETTTFRTVDERKFETTTFWADNKRNIEAFRTEKDGELETSTFGAEKEGEIESSTFRSVNERIFESTTFRAENKEEFETTTFRSVNNGEYEITTFNNDID